MFYELAGREFADSARKGPPALPIGFNPFQGILADFRKAAAICLADFRPDYNFAFGKFYIGPFELLEFSPWPDAAKKCENQERKQV